MNEPKPPRSPAAGLPADRALQKPAPATASDITAALAALQKLPAKKRIDALLERKDAMRIVRAMPTVDLFATLREVGVEDALEIVELASPQQVQGFLDLDGWRGDRIDSPGMSRWLRALFAANPDRAVGQMRGLDLELLTLLFKIHTRVFDLVQEEDPEEEQIGLHTITPDRRYLIVYGGVGDDEAMQHVLKEAVERLQARDMLFVLRLCEAVRWEMPSGLEEEAYRWRNARIADYGFLPQNEAKAIFAWLDPDAADADLPTAAAGHGDGPLIEPGEGPSTDLSRSVLLPRELLEDGSSTLGRALALLAASNDGRRDRALHELMLTSNRVHTAEGGDAGDAEALRETAKTVADTVGVALAYKSQGDAARFADPLRTTPVATLFRIGNSLSLRLQRDLRALVSAKDGGLAGNGLLRLDAPLRELCAGLLRPRPLLFGGLLDPRRVDYRPASSLAELAAAARALKEAAFRAALTARVLGATDAHLEQHGASDPALQPTHGAILTAALAPVLLGDSDVVTAPVPQSDASLARLRSVLTSATRDAAVERALLALAARVTAHGPVTGAAGVDEAVSRALAYARQALAVLDADLQALDRDPDGRFLAALWTTAARPRAKNTSSSSSVH